MNVSELGPVTSLSRNGQRNLKSLNIYNPKQWYIFAQLLDACEAGTTILIDKYKVGAPYELLVVAILTVNHRDASRTEKVQRAEMNSYVQLICDPIKFVKGNDIDEIQRAYEDANKMLSKRQ
jgi:hypothetical protein